ncbi:MAG TPA: DinB family protein [Symbiobacteriaceae bacterium]|nr:DinB family protein [Symbiobacteriaceae bacterium]
MRYSLYIDGTPGGPWMGHLLQEPGCIWLARSPEEVAERAPAALAGFFGWLRRHGEAGAVTPVGGEIAVEVAELHEAVNFGQSGGAVGLFEPDRLAATADFIATAVRRLGYARRDLLELVAELPEAALDWAPPDGKRSIRKNLHHVRNAQGWYLTRVLGWAATERQLPEPWPEATFESLRWTLEGCTTALLDLPPEYRTGIYRATEPDEDWTARKMLRRFVEHEREHIEVIRRTITAWRTGGPVARPWE